jgi:8-oxo-dGTP diphosphatase
MPRNSATPSVFLIFFQVPGKLKILMQRRLNTGHEDGNLGLPSGKVEEGEFPEQAAIREAFEECGVKVSNDKLDLLHVQYNSQPQEKGGDYINFYFLVRDWSHGIVNAEPQMCSELIYVDLEKLPKDVIPYVASVISNLPNVGITYSTYSTT